LAVSKEQQRHSERGDEDRVTTKNHDILLVGSMRLVSAEDVFRTVVSIRVIRSTAYRTARPA